MAFSVGTNEHLIRSQIWSTRLKEILEDELYFTKYVDMISEFPDGDTLNIPSIGQAEANDYEEGQSVKYNAMDTGNFTFTIDQYKSSGTYITNKMKQDSYYMDRLVSSFVPKQSRAISKAMEVLALSVGPDGQTASNANSINGAAHRWVAQGTNEVMTVNDFAAARYALQVANVPMTGLTAIVDPSVEYQMNTISNLTNVSNNPRWEGIVKDGIGTGMKFLVNIYGFDVYVSHNLKDVNESINAGGGSRTTAAGKANLFFSASSDVVPFIGAMRQAPTVESDYNKDLQREEYVTTARYGMKLYRPENLVTVLSDTDQVTV